MKRLQTAACLFVVTIVATVWLSVPAVFGQEKKTAESLLDELAGEKVDKVFAQRNKSDLPGPAKLQQKDTPKKIIVILAGNLVDPATGTVSKDMMILIQGGKILEVGSRERGRRWTRTQQRTAAQEM